MATHQAPTGASSTVTGGQDPGDSDTGADNHRADSIGADDHPPRTGSAGSGSGVGAAYKRASRKGAPRRFSCPFPGCDKIYSRAEHLQRHQLNHNPKEIYQCDVVGCEQKFVRLDLLSRHKKRHSGTYIPRNRVPNFNTSAAGGASNPTSPVTSPTSGPPPGPIMQSQQPLPQHPHPHSHPHQPRQHQTSLQQQQQQQQQQHQQQPQHSHPQHRQHPHPHQHQHPLPNAHPHPHTHPHPHPHQHHPSPTQQAQQPQAQAPPPAQQASGYPQPVSRGPYDSSILLTPSPNAGPPPRLAHSNSWPPPINDMGVNMIRSKPGNFYPRDAAPLPGPTSLMAYSGVSDEQLMARDFTVWLFDPQTSFSDFSVANLPFIEGGLESTFNNNIQFDYESLTSRSQLDPTPPRQMEGLDDIISEPRRQEILRLFQLFRKRTDRYESSIVNLVRESGGDLPALNLEMMRDCLHEYWESVSPRLPIIHQPTFSSNRCPILLLMVMVALGAASLRSRDGGGSLKDYGAFADVIIEGVRWEIVMADEATPPVGLWVAQALLLLEFYEKLYSSRRFHERAHIYHSATLTLLRRGSPLIGRAGSESPPEEAPPTGDQPSQHSGAATFDSRMWWIRWAETESMHRVVFVAFMLDIIHAAMFGHTADMAPHEIRLPLPCDDNLWTASSPDMCRQLDNNLRMYGVQPVSFLDGLKNALHGKEVKTHSFARMIIMSGLLSVGWHLSHRETHLKWLDVRTPSADTRDNWRKMLLNAFDVWKGSFDNANGDTADTRGSTNGPIHSAAMLYHLAHICLHVDIVDCQVYSGAKRLLGRKVSTRDYSNAVGRMKVWAKQASTRHAILHAFRLLHRVFVDPRSKKGPSTDAYIDSGFLPYSIRHEPDPHRPWIMYYAALSIWSFVRAVTPTHSRSPMQSLAPIDSYRRMGSYLTGVARMNDVSDKAAAAMQDGLPDLLDALSSSLGEANSDLLREAHVRLQACKDMLTGTARWDEK